MLAGTTSVTAIAFALLTGVFVHPANWLGGDGCPGGLVGAPWTSSTTSTTVTSATWGAGTTTTPLACTPVAPCKCPALEPESFRVLGTGVVGSTIEVPGFLFVLLRLAVEVGAAACVWRGCASRASEARRRQPLGGARLQLK